VLLDQRRLAPGRDGAALGASELQADELAARIVSERLGPREPPVVAVRIGMNGFE
jgi:hypothetical protein